MHLDVQDLRNFYYRSQLGRAAQKAVREGVLNLWPEAQGQTMVGYGFAVPFLRPYLADARRVIGLMPGPQGVIGWPQGMENVSVLCEETRWPLETGHVDKLLVVHGLETSEQPSALLGRMLARAWAGGLGLVRGAQPRRPLVAQRCHALWLRSALFAIPVGNQLKLHQFMPLRHRTTLYQPPSSRRFWRKTAGMWESWAGKLSPVVAGAF